jgi:hypothetical protein
MLDPDFVKKEKDRHRESITDLVIKKNTSQLLKRKDK